MKLAIKQTLQFIGSLSVLFSCLDPKAHSDHKGGGSVTDAIRSVSGLSVDWQAWGIQSGRWQATRDSVRHVPAGPPKLDCAECVPAIGPRGTRTPAGNHRFPARTTIFFHQQGSTGIPTPRTRRNGSQIENLLLALPLLPGLEKMRSLFPRDLCAGRGRGEWGVRPFWLQLIPTHQVTRGNQSRKLDSSVMESL
jgi:hypothetical protein